MLYDRSDPGPFKAIVTKRIEETNVQSIKPPMDIEVSRTLLRMGVNFSLLEKISRFKWEITFESRDRANNTINNEYVQKSSYNIEIPEYLLYRKVIIKGIPVDISKEEFLEELRASNNGLIYE